MSKCQCLGIQHACGDPISTSSSDSTESSHDNPWHWSPHSSVSSNENVTDNDTVTLQAVPNNLQTVLTTPEEELLQWIPPVTVHSEGHDDDGDDEILWSPLPDKLLFEPEIVTSSDEQLPPTVSSAAAIANLLDLADQHQQWVVSPVSDHLPLHDDDDNVNDNDNDDDNNDDDNNVLVPPLPDASPPHLPHLPDSVKIEDEHVNSFILNIVNSWSFKHPQAVNEIMYQLRMQNPNLDVGVQHLEAQMHVLFNTLLVDMT